MLKRIKGQGNTTSRKKLILFKEVYAPRSGRRLQRMLSLPTYAMHSQLGRGFLKCSHEISYTLLILGPKLVSVEGGT
jgi:hypothetical protein